MTFTSLCGVQAPTIYDPSALKTFAGGRGGVSAVREYRDESSRSDIYAVDWSRDVKVTSAISIERSHNDSDNNRVSGQQ